MKCINTNNPSYLLLEKQSGLHPFAFLLEVDSWYEKNPNEERLPTLEELGIEKEVFTIKNIAMDIAEKNDYQYNSNYVYVNGQELDYYDIANMFYGITEEDGFYKIDPVIYFDKNPNAKERAMQMLSRKIESDEQLYMLFKSYFEMAPDIEEVINDIDGFINHTNSLIESEVKVTKQTIKPRVQELFDSNPELANAVYEALGFKQEGSNIEILTSNYTRQSVQNDVNTLYLFTDNAQRTSRPTAKEDNVDKNSWYYKKYKSQTNKPIHFGSTSNPTSAVIRGLNNAYPISTMSAYGTNWTNYNFDLFKQTIDDEINQIKQDLPKFDKVKIGNFRIGQGGRFAKLPQQHQEYLDNKLLEIGIDNTGNNPKIINKQITPEQKQQAQQLYSQYLDTVFPDSKVKDIVYHDTSHSKAIKNYKEYLQSKYDKKIDYINKETFGDPNYIEVFFKDGTSEILNEEESLKFVPFETFDKNLIGSIDGSVSGKGFYFYTNPEERYNRSRFFTLNALINVKNTADKSDSNLKDLFEEPSKSTDLLKKQGYDSVVGKLSTIGTEYVVFEPEQIHILGSKQDIEGFKQFVNKPTNNNSLFGLDTQNEEQLKFHINTLNVISKFLENIGVEERLVPEFLSEDGSVIEGAIAAANFVEGTVDIIDDLNKGRAQAWNKLPEEAAHWWYRLLKENSPLKKALWESHKVALKNDELYAGKYGKLVKSPADLTEESIGQLIAEAIKRIEAKKGNHSDYSFFKKFLEWINSIIDVFKKTKIDPFEVAAMKILSSDTSDLMTLEEYRKLNNIVNFSDVLTDQSVIPIDYTLLEDIDQINYSVIYDEDTNSEVQVFYFAESPYFSTKEELDNWVTKKYGNLLIKRQKEKIVEVRDNQIFFDRLLNKTVRKKSKFLPKTLRKYYYITDSKNPNSLNEWDIAQDMMKITKKLSDQEKQQLIQTNGYTNIAPTLKVLPNLLQKYKKTPIVLSQPIKVDGAKKQELSILNGIREMIKLENPDLKSITAEEFVDEAHNWLQVNYMLGFANENSYLSYRTDQTFDYLNDKITDEDVDIANMTEEELQRLPLGERQRIANMLGITKQNPDVYHNKVSLRFNDTYHVKSSHFDKSPSAWGNLTYFYTGKNKWKDAVLLHEIQNDNIEYLRNFEPEEFDLENSLNEYLREINEGLINNIEIIESGGRSIQKVSDWEINKDLIKTHKTLNRQLQELKDLPLEQGLQQLKGKLDELIALYNSDSSKNLDKARENVDKAYSQKRMFQDLKNRGGIKSLLTKEELNNLQEILRGLNRQEETTEGNVYDEQGFPAIGYDPRYRSLSDRKQEFETLVNPITEKINKEFKRLYGKDAPRITLQATRKPRTRSEARRGVERSNKINENVNFLISYSENKAIMELHKNIEESKKNFVFARNATAANNFNVSLSKITLEQYTTLIENYKYNEALLKTLIDEQAHKDFEKGIKEYNFLEELKSEVRKVPFEEEWVLSLEEIKYKYLPKELRKNFRSNISKEALLKDFETYYNNWKAEKNITSDKEVMIFKQKKDFENLKQQALDKKAELELNYSKLEEEANKTLEIEMNYFTPLVHHLIQKHINQYGKDFPMYLIGFNAGKLTQGNRGKAILSAALYAGKEESNILTKEEIVDLKFKAANYLGVIPDTKNTPENIEKIKVYEDTKPEHIDDITNKQNLQLAMISLNGDKPFQTGIIHNLASQISGVKLIWQDKIDGLKGNTGGYLVDLSNYNYNVPILYGLSDNLSSQKTTSQQVKPGVKELFESNPELANAVYEVLGFNQMITSNDKIVFGHPTIGKSFLKKQGEDKFISLDDDYATEINNKVKEIANKYNVTTYQVKDGGTQKWNNEYNQMMQKMFNVAKQRAISENKTLFTSNTNLLKNNAESFDKVINLTDKEFERRIQERGTKYDTKEWKSQINDTISKFPISKVINTDKYLSDLFITPQQKQQAQQLYSQYIDTIFPDSKVKDIVYHGTKSSKFEKFDKKFSGTGSKNYINTQDIFFIKYKEATKTFGPNLISALINIENPNVIPLDKFNRNWTNKDIYDSQRKGDGIIGLQEKTPEEYYQEALDAYNADPTDRFARKPKNISDFIEEQLSTTYVVYEPEQIHILGSQKDIKGFKEFVSNKKELYSQLGFQGNVSLESNLKNTGKTEEEITKYSIDNYDQIKSSMLYYYEENPDITIEEITEKLKEDGLVNKKCD